MVQDPASRLETLRRNAAGTEFRSRKNKVYVSSDRGKKVVVKEFSDSDTASREYDMLSRCVIGSVPVPRPLAVLGHALVIEYLEGSTVSEVLDSAWLRRPSLSEADRVILTSVAESLGEWLAGFHRLFDFKVTRGDANMRNFLLREGSIVGLDFEEAREADVIDDLGQMCSSVLSMSPMFTGGKFEFCRCMSRRYFAAVGSDRTRDLTEAAARALRYYAAFRSDGREMVEQAIVIEKTGLLSGKQRLVQ